MRGFVTAVSQKKRIVAFVPVHHEDQQPRATDQYEYA